MNQKPSIEKLRGRHEGALAAVLGGGPMLLDDFAKIPSGAVKIAVNNWFSSAITDTADYVVTKDHPDRLPWYRSISGAKITRLSEHSDYILDIPHINLQYSAPTAVWLAIHLGCDPILLCGFDLFSIGGHCGEPGTPNQIQFCRHMSVWIRLRDLIRSKIDSLRAVSGPLVNVFGRYCPHG